MRKGFRQMLAERQADEKTLVCVGLDPMMNKMPDCIRRRTDINDFAKLGMWMGDIIEATAPFASMFKPNVAFWEAINQGVLQLGNLIRGIHNRYPDIPVFLDCKRGDIGKTQGQYARACLHVDHLGADGMNFSPYMGRDCMSGLVNPETAGKALVGLCYTSNPDAREVQDVLLRDNLPYWAFIAERTLAWAKELGVVADAGLVMAAAYEQPPKGSGVIHSQHLSDCRKFIGNEMWFLIPGVGAQGGCIEETVKVAYAGPGSIAINSSSEICFASSGEDYKQAAAAKAKELRDKINAAIPQ